MEAKEARSYLKYRSHLSPQGKDRSRSYPRQGRQTTATAILKHTPKAACEDLTKLLKSAVANAENNFGMDTDKSLCIRVLRVPPARLSRE